jgi:hypothetical protein
MAGVSFSLNSGGDVVTQQSTLGVGGSGSFQGSSGVTGQSSGGVANGGTDLNAFSKAEMAQGVFGSGVSLEALDKLTQGMIQPYIDRQKKEQYAQGMAQAAQGKALADIQAEQPWYSAIYGPDATVQGAQMYNVNAAMNQAQTDFMQAMPQLREKSPDQVRQYLVDKTASMQSTGDPYTDAMIQGKIPEMYGDMLKTHMTQYVQFTQEQNKQGFDNMGVSSAKAMQATLAADNDLSPETTAAAYANYRNQVLKPDNMTTDAYQKSLHDQIVSNAQAGNWHAVRAMQEMPEYQALDPLVKEELSTKIPLLEANAAAKNPKTMDIMNSREGLVFNMTRGQSPFDSTPSGHAAAINAMEAVNQQNKLLNGDATPVFTQEQQAEVLKQMDANNQRQQTLAAKVQNKQANYNEAATFVTQAWTSNRPDIIKGKPVEEAPRLAQLNSIYSSAMRQDASPEEQQSFWAHASANAHDSAFIVPSLKEDIVHGSAGILDGTAPATPDQQRVLQIAQQLRSGPGGIGAVKSYFGDEAEAVLGILDSHVDTTNAAAYTDVKLQLSRGKGAVASPQDKKDAVSYVKSQDPSWWKFWAGGSLSGADLSDEAKENMASEMAPIMAKNKKAFNMSSDAAAKAAFTQIMGDADLVPGTYVPEDRGRWGKEESFSAYVSKGGSANIGQQDGLYQTTFRKLIDEKITAAVTSLPNADKENFKAKDYSVSYGQYLGGGKMNLVLNKKDGTPLRIVVDGTELGQRILAAQPTYHDKSLDVPASAIGGGL